MNTRNKIFLDKFIAKPLGIILNVFVRILGKILRIDHDLDKEFKTIAISKFKGLGSILQSTPMIDAIRKRYPNAEIIYVSTKSNEGLLNKINWIDTVIVVDDSSLWRFLVSNISALWKLIKKRPEIYFDLEIYSDYSTLFTTFTLSKNRVGFYLRSSSFRMGIYTQMMFFNPRVPISKVYLQLSKLIDCDVEAASFFDFPKHEDAYKISDKPYIVINPNASDLRLERRWEMHKFIEIIKLILKKYPNFDVVLIGGKDEAKYTTEIYESIDSNSLINSAGKTTLNQLIEIIQQAALLVTNDTGPMHIAFCTKIPVVCLFGPCAPEQYGTNERAFIVYRRLYCSPCVHDFEIAPCKGDNQCMKLIETLEVFETVVKALDSQNKEMKIMHTDLILSTKEKIFGKIER